MMNQQKAYWVECLCWTSIYATESKNSVLRKLISTHLLLIVNGLHNKIDVRDGIWIKTLNLCKI